MQPVSGHSSATEAPGLLDGYSLEITTRDRERLRAARKLIPDDTCVSITFLPGDDLDLLADTAAQVRALGLIPVPHIAARRIGSAAQLKRFVTALSDRAAIDRVLVIAGDSPHPLGPFASSYDILDTGLLMQHGVKAICVAGHPEGHPRIGIPALWRALHDKCMLIERRGLRAEIVTQFAFDAQDVARWIHEVEARGIRADIRVGVPGPASVQGLLKFAARCGVGVSTRMLAKYGTSITRLLATTTPDGFLRDLASDLGAGQRRLRVHIYPFGGLEKAAAWATRESRTNKEEIR